MLQRGGHRCPQHPPLRVGAGSADLASQFDTYRAVGKWAERGSQIAPRFWWWNAGLRELADSTGPLRRTLNARTSAPVLVMGNHYDPITYYARAQATARLLPNSRLLSYEGWGHIAYPRNDCIRAHVNEYLLTGELPSKGTVCPAPPNPFNTVADQRAAPRVLAGVPPTMPGSR